MNTKDRLHTYYTIVNALKQAEGEFASDDDNTFRTSTKNEIIYRDKRYSLLLAHFIMVTRIRNYLKEFFKWSFYITIIASVISLIVLLYKLFDKYVYVANIEQVIESIPLLMTSIVGFVSTIIVIPATITKYLFSTKEDKNITEIILHTQEHDTSGRQWAMDYKSNKDMPFLKNFPQNSILTTKSIPNIQKPPATEAGAK